MRAHAAQRLGDALHRPGRERLVTGQRERPVLEGEQTGQQTRSQRDDHRGAVLGGVVDHRRLRIEHRDEEDQWRGVDRLQMSLAIAGGNGPAAVAPSFHHERISVPTVITRSTGATA